MEDNYFFYSKKLHAARAVKKLMKSYPDLVIWDSETTGLQGASFVSIAAIDLHGNILFDSTIDPQIPITDRATEIHGISWEQVVGPTFMDVYPDLERVFKDRPWAIYNASFDTGVLFSEMQDYFPDTVGWVVHSYHPKTGGWDEAQFRRQVTSRAPLSSSKVFCVMKMIAPFFGYYSPRHGDFTWVKLVEAADHFNIEVKEKPHSAVGDCLRTLLVMREIVAWLDRQQPYLAIGRTNDRNTSAA